MTKKNEFKTLFQENLTAEEFIRLELRGDDYDRGAVEAAEAQAKHATYALARLVQMLHDRNTLSAQDVEDIAKSRYSI